MKPIIGITMGDPSGIGPEVVTKALKEKEIYQLCAPLVIGDGKVMEKLGKVNSIKEIKEAKFNYGEIDVLDLDNVEIKKLKIGEIDARSGYAAYEYIEKATILALKGSLDAITTAPINKESFHKAGINYPGHTEILAKLTNTRKYAMMLVAENLRVVLVTIHLSLRKAVNFIREEKILETIKLTYKAMKSLDLKKPRIAVAGLNPHASEGGLFGQEEKKEIKPAIEAANEQKIKVEGPFSADTIFLRTKRGEFDVAIAMYHDQGLIPIKMCSFGRGVNVTIGLPIIRTSCDHGTAFDIAGKGIANPGSMAEAIKLAAEMAKKQK